MLSFLLTAFVLLAFLLLLTSAVKWKFPPTFECQTQNVGGTFHGQFGNIIKKKWHFDISLKSLHFLSRISNKDFKNFQ